MMMGVMMLMETMKWVLHALWVWALFLERLVVIEQPFDGL